MPDARVILIWSHSQGEDQVVSDITRALIKGLPRLFLKHQGDESRIADVLLLPSFMNLETYLEMRMVTVRSPPVLANVPYFIPPLGLRTPLGRRYEAPPFTILSDCSCACRCGHPEIHERNFIVQHE